MKKEHTTLSTQAYDILKSRIMTMEGGSYISARQMATELSMSYTPVREALIKLNQEGYVKQIPNVGFIVSTADITDHVSFYEARECVELFVISNVIDSITTEDIDLMRRYNGMLSEYLEKNDTRVFAEVDTKIHMVFMNRFGNQYLSDFYENLRTQFLMRTFHVSRVGQPNVIEEHEKIISALEKHDADAACNALREHIIKSKERITSFNR